jgi:hypothetical protein
VNSTTKAPMSASPSTSTEDTAESWPALPTETEIYILPDGRVVVADLPAELAPFLTELGAAEPCAVDPDEDSADGVQ